MKPVAAEGPSKETGRTLHTEKLEVTTKLSRLFSFRTDIGIGVWVLFWCQSPMWNWTTTTNYLLVCVSGLSGSIEELSRQRVLCRLSLCKWLFIISVHCDCDCRVSESPRPGFARLQLSRVIFLLAGSAWLAGWQCGSKVGVTTEIDQWEQTDCWYITLAPRGVPPAGAKRIHCWSMTEQNQRACLVKVIRGQEGINC